jgi:hypothetical protein
MGKPRGKTALPKLPEKTFQELVHHLSTGTKVKALISCLFVLIFLHSLSYLFVFFFGHQY